MSGQRECLSRRGRAGPLAQGSGLGLQGWPAPHTEASRVGFGQVFRCLDAYVNFLQRFSVGNVESAGFAAKGGDYWDPVRCRGVIPDARTEAKGKGLGGLSVMRCPGASVPTGLKSQTRALFPRASSPTPDFLLSANFVLSLVYGKRALEFSWCKALVNVS